MHKVRRLQFEEGLEAASDMRQVAVIPSLEDVGHVFQREIRLLHHLRTCRGGSGCPECQAGIPGAHAMRQLMENGSNSVSRFKLVDCSAEQVAGIERRTLLTQGMPFARVHRMQFILCKAATAAFHAMAWVAHGSIAGSGDMAEPGSSALNRQLTAQNIYSTLKEFVTPRPEHSLDLDLVPRGARHVWVVANSEPEMALQRILDNACKGLSHLQRSCSRGSSGDGALEPHRESFVRTLAQTQGSCAYYASLAQALHALDSQKGGKQPAWLPAGAKQVFSCVITKSFVLDPQTRPVHYLLPRVLVTVEPYDLRLSEDLHSLFDV